jgi:fructose-1,6-bisphosphatase I
MPGRETLDDDLANWAVNDARRGQVRATILALAEACRDISDMLALGGLGGSFSAPTGKQGEVDQQRELDVLANNKIMAALARAPVGTLISEELDEPLAMTPGGPLTVAVDPLDGASNADTNAAIGTIFSILPPHDTGQPDGLLLPGSAQLAAGFAVYGPQTVLALTVGAGTALFTLDRRSGQFLANGGPVQIPPQAAEFAINASNHWHWDEPIRTYVDDCLRGKAGPRAADYNMRWTGSFVAEIYRILMRGGIYLYPGDQRRGFRDGRMRFLYEAAPVAFVVEQAGGAASNGCDRILDLTPIALHSRTPVVLGSRAEVAYVERLHRDPHAISERSPLFGRRGLFRV